MEIFIYLMALALQLSGGLILLLKNIILSPERLGEEYCAGNIIIRIDEETQKIIVDPLRLAGLLNNVYLNRAAFVCLVVGYGINVFGELGSFCKCLALVIIVSISGIICFIAFKICKNCAEKNSVKEKYKNIVRKNIPNDTMAI